MKYDHAATLARLRGIRPTRGAAGMTATFERQRAFGTWRGRSRDDALRLAVHGTCDVLATTMRNVSPKRCECCNGTGRAGYQLSDKGHRSLKKLRERGTNKSTDG